MAEIYHPVSTTNSEAQKSFDRGLTYVFAYEKDLSQAWNRETALRRKQPLNRY